MHYEFNHGQLREDLDDLKRYLSGLFKSIGPSQKKIEEQPIGLFKEQHVRFRLRLVEMGISQVIRLSIFILVGIFLYFSIFRFADTTIRIIIAFGYLLFYASFLKEHLAKDGKPVSTLAGHLLSLDAKRVSTAESVHKTVLGAVGSIGNLIPSVGPKGAAAPKPEAPKK